MEGTERPLRSNLGSTSTCAPGPERGTRKRRYSAWHPSEDELSDAETPAAKRVKRGEFDGGKSNVVEECRPMVSLPRRTTAKGWAMTWVVDDVVGADTSSVVLSESFSAREQRVGTPEWTKMRAREELEIQLAAKDRLLSQHQDALSSIAGALVCKVCLDICRKPYVLGCGHLFCSTCLRDWFTSDASYNSELEEVPPVHKRVKTCPACRIRVHSAPVEVYQIKDVLALLYRNRDLLPPTTFPPGSEANLASEASPSTGASISSSKPWADLFPDNEPTSRLPFGMGVDEDDNVAPDDYMGIHDLEDGGIYRCELCLHEIEDGMCSNEGCGRIFPAHQRNNPIFGAQEDNGARARGEGTGARGPSIFGVGFDHPAAEIPGHIREQLASIGRNPTRAFDLRWPRDTPSPEPAPPPRSADQPSASRPPNAEDDLDAEPTEPEDNGGGDDDEYESDFIDDGVHSSGGSRRRESQRRRSRLGRDGAGEDEREDSEGQSDSSLEVEEVIDLEAVGTSGGSDDEEEWPVRPIRRNLLRRVLSDADDDESAGEDDREVNIRRARRRRTGRRVVVDADDDEELEVDDGGEFARTVRGSDEEELGDEILEVDESGEFNAVERDVYGEDDFVPRRRRRG